MDDALRDLCKPSPARWLTAAVADWALVAAAVAAVAVWGVWLVVPAAVVIGTRQHAIGVLGHDGAHGLVCRNRWWNDLLTNLVSFWPLGMSLRGYRAFHFAHHRRVGTAEDPEKVHTADHPRLGQWRRPLRPRRLLRQLAFDLFGGGVPHLAMAARLTDGRRPHAGPACVIGGAVLACWWFGCLWVMALWFGSLVTVFWLAFRLRIWTEHTAAGGEPPTHRVAAAWWQRLLFLPHNTWCHWEHHAHPAVPAHNLPRVRALAADGPPVVTLGRLLRRLRET